MRLPLLAGLAALALSAAGCGSTPAGPAHGGADGRKIAELVSLFNDDKSTWGTAKRHFVADFKPADPRKYAQFAFEVKGDPQVSGDTATATVGFTSERKGEEVGEQQWTFAQVGGEWKIKTAPLP